MNTAEFLSAAMWFLFVCLLGSVVMRAGGVQWGSDACGLGTALTILFAGCAAYLGSR